MMVIAIVCYGILIVRSSCYLCDPTADTVKVDVQAYYYSVLWYSLTHHIIT